MHGNQGSWNHRSIIPFPWMKDRPGGAYGLTLIPRALTKIRQVWNDYPRISMSLFEMKPDKSRAGSRANCIPGRKSLSLAFLDRNTQHCFDFIRAKSYVQY
jgi:hypothetical protein